LLVRQRGEALLSPDEIPALLDEETPQQLLMAAFRKYRR
jgi:heterodisulfide reductase subunit C